MAHNKAQLLNAARLLHEEMQHENIKRNVRYLNPYAEGSSIAEHIGTTVKIAWVLARLAKEKNPKVNVNKVVNMIIWHDTEETRTWDLGRDVRMYIEINEKKALEDKFEYLKWGDEIVKLKNKFENKESKDINVQLARDADVIYVIITIKKMVKAGIPIHEPKKRMERTTKRLMTTEGKALAKALADSDINEWWDVMRGYKKVTKSGKTANVG